MALDAATKCHPLEQPLQRARGRTRIFEEVLYHYSWRIPVGRVWPPRPLIFESRKDLERNERRDGNEGRRLADTLIIHERRGEREGKLVGAGGGGRENRCLPGIISGWMPFSCPAGNVVHMRKKPRARTYVRTCRLKREGRETRIVTVPPNRQFFHLPPPPPPHRSVMPFSLSFSPSLDDDDNASVRRHR